MSIECRKELVGTRIFVIDPLGEQVGVYSREQAVDEATRCSMKEDAMWETAKLLVDTAIKGHMEMHGVGRETARRLLRHAAEVVE